MRTIGLSGYTPPCEMSPMPVANNVSTTNSLLDALPRKDYQQLLSGLQPVELFYGQVLYDPAQPIEQVYFPTNCLISLLTAVDKHRTLEVGMVGNEGMVGMPLALGINASGVRALVQGTGTALCMTAKRFMTEFRRSPPLQHAVFRYTHFLMAQVSQTAACNRFHNTNARLARWLLMTGDRLGAHEFHLTQEFLADMLGIRRVGVTKAASVLQQKKLIEYRRGHLSILDRQGLEAAACTCYRVVKDLQDILQKQPAPETAQRIAPRGRETALAMGPR